MPTENDKKTETPASENLKDAKDLKKLQEENKKLSAKLATVEKENGVLAQDLEDARKKLAAKPQAEAGGEKDNYVVLRGKRYDIERTVEAKFATDEARKGYIDLDAELVVLKR